MKTETAPALDAVTPSPAPTPSAPKFYTFAEVDAASPFPVAVTWANLAWLVEEANSVHVHFHAYAGGAPNDPIGRGMEVPKSAVFDRARNGSGRHGNAELVHVYTMGGGICFGI